MAVSNKPIFPQVISNFTPARILPADTTTQKTIVTAGANGAKVESIIIHSTDTAAKDVVLVMTVSAVDYPIGTISIPANSGNTNALPPISFFKHANITDVLNIDGNGNRYLYLAAGAILKVNVTATLTASKVMSFIPQGGDF